MISNLIDKKARVLFLVNLIVVTGFLVFKIVGDNDRETKLNTLLTQNDTQTVLGMAYKQDGCKVNASLPDADCTPGAVFPLATREEICVSGYTKTVRNVSTSTKKKVYKMYGIEYPQKRGDYEVDHLIPLAIGGSNEITNLWPEAADPTPGFKEKDVVEVYLREQVCQGKVDLTAAQQQIAKDWLAVYGIISQDDQKRIRKTYTNWSN